MGLDSQKAPRDSDHLNVESTKNDALRHADSLRSRYTNRNEDLDFTLNAEDTVSS